MLLKRCGYIAATLVVSLSTLTISGADAQELKYSAKPPLHGNHWVAITGKPRGATAGAMIFNQGGNAVDAASAMLAATATMWDTLGWGGETQALIYNPNTEEVLGINALGAAPSGATPEYFQSLGLEYPPDFGPLAAVTPGTPGGLMVMLAEFGTMSLAEVLAPALDMAAGYPMESVRTSDIEENRDLISQWPASRELFLPHLDANNPDAWAAPYPGEMFRQPDLLKTLNKLVQAEREALADGASREDAIMAAYERFYQGDIAEAIASASQEAGGLITTGDLADWQVYIEEPVSTTYKDIEVFKLTHWVQGPVLLQMLNMLENFDLQKLGRNSASYIHVLYQVMNLAFADRDFYYGDPYFPPEEPIEGLLSRDYAKDRAASINMRTNRTMVAPGDPYPYQGESNPFSGYLENWMPHITPQMNSASRENSMDHDEGFLAGTTTIQAADAEGWVVSITPSGAWVPAFIAGDTGIGLSQRMQSFDMDPARNPYNVLEPGKRPRATLTPSLALKNGKPYLSFAVQGGDSQDQNLLQFLLNIVEFGMGVQQATEAANFNSYQMHSSFGDHSTQPGRLLIRADTPEAVIRQLQGMGYYLEAAEMTSGPINAILFNQEQGTMTGGSSNYGDDYGIAW